LQAHRLKIPQLHLVVASRLGRLITLGAVAVLTACCAKQKVEAPPMPEPTVEVAPTGDLYHRPHVTIVAVTDWQSVLKPCGCTVDLQKGGIERIVKFVDDLRQKDDSVLVVHAGSLLADPDATTGARAAQMASRLQAFSDSLDHLHLAAVPLSSYDLEVGGQLVSSVYDAAKWPLLAMQGGARKAMASTMVRTKSGVSVGILGVDPKAPEDDSARQQIVQDELVRLRSQGVKVVVVLSNLGLRASRRLARAVQGIDVMVIGQLDDKIEPELDLEREGATLILQAGRHGAWLSALTVAPSGHDHGWKEVSEQLPGVTQDLAERIAGMEKILTEIKARSTVANQKALPLFEARLAEMKIRYEAAVRAQGQPLPPGPLVAFRPIGLAWSSPVDPDVAKIVADYDAKVADANVKAAGAVLPPLPGQASYVGQAVCMGCHDDTAGFKSGDLHQKAWEGLEKAKKDKDLDCVACHATGFGQPGGSNLAHLERLTNVQCESCHGPGSLHVKAPARGPNSHIIAQPDATICATCHTAMHSPRFEFEDYRKRLIVPGHGLPMRGTGKP
jgi:hypothetical protein